MLYTSLTLIITLRFICGERKSCSQNIINMIAVDQEPIKEMFPQILIFVYMKFADLYSPYGKFGWKISTNLGGINLFFLFGFVLQTCNYRKRNFPFFFFYVSGVTKNEITQLFLNQIRIEYERRPFLWR